MIKKLAIALSLALALVMALGTVCFASEPPDGDNVEEEGFNVEWCGSVDGGRVGTSAFVATEETYTQFSTEGSAIFGCFKADAPCCGTTENSLAAFAFNGETKYFTSSGDDDENGQFVKLESGSDCESWMLVSTETECADLESYYALGAKGCEFKVKAEAADWDCGILQSYVKVAVDADAGEAAIMGTANDDFIADALCVEAEGEGELEVAASSEDLAQINGVEIYNGYIALIAEFGDGIDAQVCVSAGEPIMVD